MKPEVDERDILRQHEDEDDKTWSEHTPVRLALVILIVSGTIGFTWWASKVQSSLDMLLAGQSREIEHNNGIRQRIEKLERDSDLFMQVGSPALRNRIEPIERWKEQIQSSGSPQVGELSKRLAALEMEWQTHKAQEKGTK